VRVLLDHPRRHLGLRLWRKIGDLTGALLVVLGLTASIPALPASLAVISFVLGWATSQPTDPNPWPSADVPVRQIVIVWAIVTPIAIGGLRLGLRLLRRNRTLVLFLRRFGHDDAQSAVTFAVMRTIGSSWRVVTLDDAEMVPIGVHAGTRHAFRAGEFATKQLLGIGQLLGVRLFPYLILTMWGVLALGMAAPAIEYARTGTTTPEPWIAAIDPYLEIITSVFEGRLPIGAVAPTLPGLFAVVVTAAAISFAVMGATVVVLMLAVPLSTTLFFLSASADSVREAESAKTVAVTSLTEIRHAADAIARRSRKVFGPRLVVIRVASRVWQQAVTELAARASLPLIDISEPTENVLWELESLIGRFGDACVVIGQYERVAVLAGVESGDRALSAVERRMATLLDDREVLAYTTDPKGLRRFARALRGRFLMRHA
jgi:hypothetical protein